MILKTIFIALTLAFILDWILGDPIFRLHPIRLIGRLISKTEKIGRSVFPATKQGELIAGVFIVIISSLVPTFFCLLLLWGCGKIHIFLVGAVQTLLCYFLLAARDLQKHAQTVAQKLQANDIKGARHAVSMIVGRDTASLTEEEVAKATVETVAENFSDGVVSPLFFMALGGVPLMIFFKAVSTMDSMIGYQNSLYQYVGRTAAKLDDILNFIPARFSALFLIVAAFFFKKNAKNAWRIFKRDRFNHKSPNSAQAEAAMAGALDIQLGGSATYFGVYQKKPTIGDTGHIVTAKDIQHSISLMKQASIWATLFFTLVAFLVYR